MNELDGLYQELILDHAKRPIGRTPFEAPAGTITASHHEFNPSCGDELTLHIAVSPASSEIQLLTWEGQGCSVSTASASMLSQLLREETMTVAQAHTRIAAFRDMIHSRGQGEGDEALLGDAIALQGVSKFVMRVKCAMLAWVALEAALSQISDS